MQHFDQIRRDPADEEAHPAAAAASASAASAAAAAAAVAAPPHATPPADGIDFLVGCHPIEYSLMSYNGPRRATSCRCRPTCMRRVVSVRCHLLRVHI